MTNQTRTNYIRLALLAIVLAALLLFVAIAVADADGPTLWKAHCPRHHTVTSVPDVDGDGVHILCTRAALEADR